MRRIARRGCGVRGRRQRFPLPLADEANVVMIARATRVDRARGQEIAQPGGRTLKQLRTARMRVFRPPPLLRRDEVGGPPRHVLDRKNDRRHDRRGVLCAVAAPIRLPAHA